MMRTKLSALLVLVGAAFVAPAQTDDEIDSWAERVRRYLGRGQWSRLIAPAEKVLAADPDDEEMAKALLFAARATGAKETRAKLIRIWRGRAEADSAFWFLERVEFLIETGADDRALALLTTRVRKKPNYFFESLIGEIHADRGRDQKSRQVFESLVDRAKKEIVREPLQLVGLARAYLSYAHGGDPAEAALVEAKGRDEANVRVRELLAQVYELRKERPTDMRREYLDLLKIRPSWPDYEVGLARAAQLRLGLAGKEQKAAIARALAINPNHPDALFMRGVELLSGGTEKRASAAFKKGLDFNPNHKPCLSGAATIAYLKGGEEAWGSARDGVLRRDPTYGRLFQIAADILNNRRRWSESLEFMREGVATDSRDPRLWDDFARYCLYLGLEDEGQKALKKADSLVKFGRVWRNNMHEVLRILDKNYVLIETPHFLIRVHKNHEIAFRQDLPGFLENSFAEFQKRYDCTPPQKILWEVFADHKSFSVRTMGLTGLGLLGVCFGPTVAMDGPSARPTGSYNWASTAHHELAHVFTLQLSRNRVPRWLTEGLSTHEETRRNKGWGRGMEVLLHDALMTDTLFNVRGFDSAFSGPRIGFAYFQAGLMANLLMRDFGPTKVSHLLRLFGEDRALDEAFAKSLGVRPEEFDKRFAEYVKQYLGTMSRVPTLGTDEVKKVATKVADETATDKERIRLAWAYLRMGKSFDAGRVIEPLLKSGSDDVELTLLKASRAARAKRPDIAVSLWQEAMRAGSTDFDMLMGLAKHAEGEGKGAEALTFFQAAARSNPFARTKAASPLLDVARLLEGEGRTVESVGALEAFTAMSDKALGVRRKLLAYYRGKGNTLKVGELLQEIIWITPFNVEVREQHAKALAALGKVEAAVVEFEVALSLSDETTEGNLRKELGRLLSTLDRYDDAVYHLERAVTLDGDDVEAQELLREAEENLKTPERS